MNANNHEESYAAAGVDNEKQGHRIAEKDTNENGDTRRRSSAVDADVLTGEIYDTRFETTQRGLKSRHAQMIALGT